MIRSALALLMIAACGGGKGGGSTGAVSEADALAPCRTGCEHDVACGEESAVEPCAADCVDALAGWMRRDALEELAACSSGLACDGENRCLDQIQPLSEHREWEAECRVQLASCFEPADLEIKCDADDGMSNFFPFIAPDIVIDMIACLDGADCSARTACVASTLDAVGFLFPF